MPPANDYRACHSKSPTSRHGKIPAHGMSSLRTPCCTGCQNTRSSCRDWWRPCHRAAAWLSRCRTTWLNRAMFSCSRLHTTDHGPRSWPVLEASAQRSPLPPGTSVCFDLTARAWTCGARPITILLPTLMGSSNGSRVPAFVPSSRRSMRRNKPNISRAIERRLQGLIRFSRTGRYYSRFPVCSWWPLAERGLWWFSWQESITSISLETAQEKNDLPEMTTSRLRRPQLRTHVAFAPRSEYLILVLLPRRVRVTIRMSLQPEPAQPGLPTRADPRRDKNPQEFMQLD